MAVSAFSPGHLTGIFRIYGNTSAGAGITLQHGMHTTLRTSHRGRTCVFINGGESRAPVSKYVISKFSAHSDCVPFEVRHRASLPIGCGLGMSAAGALSLSLALNEWCGSPFGPMECIKIAHDADVACGTGLASVDVQSLGGMVSRKGSRGLPDVRRLSPRELRHPLYLAVFGPMRTSSIIRSKKWKARLDSTGKKALGDFYKKRGMASLAEASNRFALSSTLGNWARPALSSSPGIGMAMLGKTLFSSSHSAISSPAVSSLGAHTLIRTYPTNKPASLCP